MNKIAINVVSEYYMIIGSLSQNANKCWRYEKRWNFAFFQECL